MNRREYLDKELKKACISKDDFKLYLKMKRINRFVCDLNNKHEKKIDLDFYLDEPVKSKKSSKSTNSIKSTNYSSSTSDTSKTKSSNNNYSSNYCTSELIKPKQDDYHMIGYFEKNNKGIVVRNVLNSNEYKLYQTSNQDIINSLMKCSNVYDRFFYMTYERKLSKNRVCFINITGLVELEVKFVKGKTRHIKDGIYCFDDGKNDYSTMDDYIFKQYEHKKIGMYYVDLELLRKKPRIRGTRNVYVVKLGEI